MLTFLYYLINVHIKNKINYLFISGKKPNFNEIMEQTILLHHTTFIYKKLRSKKSLLFFYVIT